MTGDQSRTDDEQNRPTTTLLETPAIPKDVLSLDHVFDALAHPRRRYLCYTLLETTEWSLSELATKIAAWERGVAEQAVTNWHKDRVYAALFHSHVPKLVDLGIIEYDDATETIEPAENAEQVLRALAGMGESLDSAQESHARSEMDEST